MTTIENKYTIYSIPNKFTIAKNADGSWDCKSFTGTIDEILKKLEKDKSYALRINPEKECVFYGDFDHGENEEVFEEFIDELCNLLKITRDDIKFTYSHKKIVNEHSYHYSIPSIITTPKDLKIFF